MDIEPGTYHLRIRQGKTLRKPFEVTNDDDSAIDLSGYSARAQIRQTVESTTTILDLTVANGGVVMGGPAGTITLVCSAATTAAMAPVFGVWDLELIEPSGDVSPLLEGQVAVLPEVTR